MQARGERHQRLFHAFSRQGANEILVASVAQWEEDQKDAHHTGAEESGLCQAIEQISERQDLLAAWLEKMKTFKRMLRTIFTNRFFNEKCDVIFWRANLCCVRGMCCDELQKESQRSS